MGISAHVQHENMSKIAVQYSNLNRQQQKILYKNRKLIIFLSLLTLSNLIFLSDFEVSAVTSLLADLSFDR